MAEFAYKNAKNTNISYIPFEVDCKYYSHVLYKKDVDPYFKSKTVNKLAIKVTDFIETY